MFIFSRSITCLSDLMLQLGFFFNAMARQQCVKISTESSKRTRGNNEMLFCSTRVILST